MRDFRTYARAEARLGEGLTVIHGPNAAGKSNLLEALYFGCTGRSPRTRNERELGRFGANATRVAVVLLDGAQGHELTVGYGSVPGTSRSEKRMTSDGAPVERLLDVSTRPLVSVFLPDRLELLKSTPSLRRAHLDHVAWGLCALRARTARRAARKDPLGVTGDDARDLGPGARAQRVGPSRSPRRDGRHVDGAV